MITAYNDPLIESLLFHGPMTLEHPKALNWDQIVDNILSR
jgi:hypothetical protein